MILVALLAGCIDSPEKAARANAAAAPPEPVVLVVELDDLWFAPTTPPGVDRVRGLAAVHDLMWGQRDPSRPDRDCHQAHELRIEGFAFPRAEHCTTWGQFRGFVGTAMGVEPEHARAFVERLEERFGPAQPSTDRGYDSWHWQGLEVAMEVEWTWWSRLRIRVRLEENYVRTTFERPSDRFALYDPADVGNPSVRCKAEGLTSGTPAMASYGLGSPRIYSEPATIGPGWVAIHPPEGSTEAFLVVDGFAPAPVEWAPPAPGRRLVWCTNGPLRLERVGPVR